MKSNKKFILLKIIMKTLQQVQSEIESLLSLEDPMHCSVSCLLAILLAYEKRSFDKERKIPQYIVLDEKDGETRRNFIAFFRRCLEEKGNKYRFHIFYRAYFCGENEHWYLIELKIKNHSKSLIQFDSLCGKSLCSFTRDLKQNLVIDHLAFLDVKKRLQLSRYGCLVFMLDLSFRTGCMRRKYSTQYEQFLAYFLRNAQNVEVLKDHQGLFDSDPDNEVIRRYLMNQSNFFRLDGKFFNHGCTYKLRSWLTKTKEYLETIKEENWRAFVDRTTKSPVVVDEVNRYCHLL